MPGAKMKPGQPTQQQDPDPKSEEIEKPEQMCCDGERTAAEHRKESGDGKCCSD
jgi:hypothetical protein